MNNNEITCSFPLTIKSTGDKGVITGIAATRELDRYGHIIAPGAWTATIEAWKARGTFPPLLANHNQNRVVGVLTAM